MTGFPVTDMEKMGLELGSDVYGTTLAFCLPFSSSQL